jgi:hypothetical protein
MNSIRIIVEESNGEFDFAAKLEQNGSFVGNFNED